MPSCSPIHREPRGWAPCGDGDTSVADALSPADWPAPRLLQSSAADERLAHALSICDGRFADGAPKDATEVVAGGEARELRHALQAELRPRQELLGALDA